MDHQTSTLAASAARPVRAPSQRPRRAPQASRVAQALRDQITAGVVAVGDRLPAETTLALTHGVSRVTVREALRRLAAEGRVISHQGRGTFVTEVKVVQQMGAAIGFHASMRARGLAVESRVLSMTTRKASRAAAAALALKSGAMVVEVVRLRLIENSAVSLHVISLPACLGSRLRPQDLESDLLPVLEREHAVPLGRIRLQIGTGRCPSAIAGPLAVARGELLLILRRTTHDFHHTPIEYEVMHCRQGACEFLIDIPRTPG